MLNLADQILDDVRKNCTNVPDFIVKDAINKGTRRFLLESQLWQDEQELSAYAKVILVNSDYANTYISDVKSVRTKNDRFIPATFRNGSIEFKTAPNTDIIATLVIITTGDSPVVPEWILYQHRDALIHSAVQKLKSQSGQPWFDPDGDFYHDREYRQHLGHARIAAMPDSVTFKPFL